MKISETLKKEPEKTVILSVLTIVFCCYIIPSCSGLLKSVGAAILFTTCFCFYPDWFRSRSRSLIPAFCLTAFVWLCAVVMVVFPFFGTH